MNPDFAHDVIIYGPNGPPTDSVLSFSYDMLWVLGFLALLGCVVALLLRRRKRSAAMVFGAVGCLALVAVLYLGSSIFADDPKMSLKKKAWPCFRLTNDVRHFELGYIAMDADLYERAIEGYKLALSDTAFTDRVHCLTYLGNSYQLLEMYEEAISCYDSMLQLTRGHSDTWDCRGVSLVSIGRLEDAVRSFDSSLFYHSNRSDSAVITSYGRARIDRPNAHRAWIIVAEILSWKKQYERAAMCIDSALTYALSPVDKSSWLFRGDILCRLGRFEEALASLDSASNYGYDDGYLRKAIMDSLKRNE